jgi:predicted phage-related endonuclease
VPAKRAFEGAPGYDPKKALAIPNAELDKLGVRHANVTGAQKKLYQAFAETGQPLTWEAIAKIETEALVDAKMNLDIAKATVAKAIKALKDAGVAAPLRIPWGK